MNRQTRIEEDLLGFREISNDVFYGIHTLRAAENFRISVFKTSSCQRITANEDVCKDYVMNTIGIVTYLNPYIGHQSGDLVGKICRATGKSVREIILEKQLMEESLLDQVLSAQNLAKPIYPVV